MTIDPTPTTPATPSLLPIRAGVVPGSVIAGPVGLRSCGRGGAVLRGRLVYAKPLCKFGYGMLDYFNLADAFMIRHSFQQIFKRFGDAERYLLGFLFAFRYLGTHSNQCTQLYLLLSIQAATQKVSGTCYMLYDNAIRNGIISYSIIPDTVLVRKVAP